MKPDQNKITKWLDQLQQESWQLELIVSGFAIFLLVAALEELETWHRELRMLSEGFDGMDKLIVLGVIVLMIACLFIVINLILHLILRGIWISAIGLRYVSGDIDFDSLKLAPKFDRFLRRKIKSFDTYIINLENICSIVFAFTFLIVFILFSFLLFFFVTTSLGIFMEQFFEWLLPKKVAEVLNIGIGLILLLFGLIYLIDFVTIGYLKRIKWLSVFYYPFYRFFSFITLSRVYRPIYYNLIDNKFGKRIGLLLVPYVLVVIFLLSGKINSYVWFPFMEGNFSLSNEYYDDLRKEEEIIVKGSIPSKYVKNGFLEIFIRYRPLTDDKLLATQCPDVTPFRENGISTDIKLQVDKKEEERRLLTADSSLHCLSDLFEIAVNDSIFEQPGFRFHVHKNKNEPGLLSVLDVSFLPRGEHQLFIRKLKELADAEKANDKPAVAMEDYIGIPFWIE